MTTSPTEDALDSELPGTADAPAGELPAGVTQLLHRWARGDAAALDQVLPLVYRQLRHLAHRHLRQERANHTLQGTGLVHEAYLRLSHLGPLRWESRAHFFGWASTLMRHILVDHARAHRAAKRGGGAPVMSLDEIEEAGTADALMVHVAQADDALDLIALDHALKRLERLDAQQSRVVELRFFGGLSVAETAQALQISPATVKREWATARAWLLRELGRAGA